MDHRFKSKWGKNNDNFIFDHQKDYCGFSWPQRNFMCNFCNKEYKSAQALGGHMNVHRRDRAKLRLSSPPPPPLDNDQHQPSPLNSNPKCVSPVRYQPYKTYHSSLFPHVLSTTNIEDEQHDPILFARSGIDFLGCRGKKNMTMEDGEKEEGYGIRVWKKTEIFNIKMEMEMGLLKDGKIELDLELRLGRS